MQRLSFLFVVVPTRKITCSIINIIRPAKRRIVKGSHTSTGAVSSALLVWPTGDSGNVMSSMTPPLVVTNYAAGSPRVVPLTVALRRVCLCNALDGGDGADLLSLVDFHLPTTNECAGGIFVGGGGHLESCVLFCIRANCRRLVHDSTILSSSTPPRLNHNLACAEVAC